MIGKNTSSKRLSDWFIHVCIVFMHTYMCIYIYTYVYK